MTFAAGGITESRKIAALSQAHSTQCVPHAWGTAIGLAATLQFLASLAQCPPCLVPMPPLLEYEQAPNPFRDDLEFFPCDRLHWSQCRLAATCQRAGRSAS